MEPLPVKPPIVNITAGGKAFPAEKRKKKKTSFFFIIACIGIFAVVAGFAKPFIIPLSTGNFKAPASVHVHGAFAFAWILYYFMQTSLIRVKNYRLHMAVSSWGLLIACGTAITMLPAGVFVVQKGLKDGISDNAYSSIMGVVMSALMFLTLVIAGVFLRKKKNVHKRFMLLACIVVLWPAWFRFRHYFPSVPDPDIWFGVVLADSFILVAWIRDWINEKRVHPVLLYGGSFIILENSFELLFFDHGFWRAAGKTVYEVVSFMMF